MKKNDINSAMNGRNAFLRKLFQRCKGFLEVRAIGDDGKVKSKFIPLAGGLNTATEQIDEFCDIHKGWNLYFGIGTKDGNGRRKRNTVNLPCTWADIDYKTISKKQFEEKLNKFPFKPTLIVSSGRGQHLYFLLDKQADQEAGGNIEIINDWVASELGGDNVKDIARVMRLPDTVNHKYEDRPLCKVEGINNNTYSLDEFLKYIPKKKENFKTRRRPVEKLPPDILEAQIRYICEQIKDQDKIISEGDTYKEWLNVAFAFVDGLGENGREFFHIVSSVSPKYVERETNEQYNACLESDERTTRTKKTPIGYFIRLAKKAGLRTHKGLRNDRKQRGNGSYIFNTVLEARIFKEDDGKKFIIHGKQLLMYKDGFYQPFEDEYYLKLLEEQIEFVFDGRVAKAREILERLKHQHTTPKEQEVNINPELLNVKNGLLNINTLELQPHTPDLVYTYQIVHNYNSDAECKKWKKFLREVLVKEDTLEPDKALRKIVKRVVGYCLYPKIPFHEAFIFLGSGSNGKGVLCKVLTELMSKELTSAVDFGKIGNDKFASSHLVGKLLNISYDFSNIGLGDGDIKAIIGGDPIFVQRKNERGFDYAPITKHVICVNELPYSKDKSYGFFRRFNIIPFHKKFIQQVELNNIDDDEERDVCKLKDTHLEEKLTSKEEMEGVLVWAVGGLRRLLQEKEFPYSKQVQKLKDTFKIRCSSVEMFLEDKVEESRDSNILQATMQRYYIDYCREHNVPTVGERSFGIEVKKVGYEIERRSVNGKTRRYVLGVCLKDE